MTSIVVSIVSSGVGDVAGCEGVMSSGISDISGSSSEPGRSGVSGVSGESGLSPIGGNGEMPSAALDILFQEPKLRGHGLEVMVRTSQGIVKGYR